FLTIFGPQFSRAYAATAGEDYKGEGGGRNLARFTMGPGGRHGTGGRCTWKLATRGERPRLHGSVMRTRQTIVTAGLLCAALAAFLAPREAAAQAIPPAAPRDENWEAVSQISMITGALSVTLMPRVYYNDPEATVGWKGRWHVSQLAPAL